jgi:heme-degrading monooxygenase HmoA
MYNRVITLTGVEDVDAAVGVLRDALPTLQSQRGYQGMIGSADRANGLVGITSLWDTEADRDASESALAKTREEASRQIGAADMTVEAFEEWAVEVRTPPAVGCHLLVTRISMDPAKVDENLEFFKREVAPQIAASGGFRTLRNMMNPRTGEGLVGTVWDDESSMRAAADAAMARRAEATSRGVTFGDISRREIVFVDLT